MITTALAKIQILAVVMVVFIGGCSASSPSPTQLDPRTQPWSAVLTEARGQTVTMQMWEGDLTVNRYMRTYVAPQLERRYGIRLRLIPGQGDAIVNQVMTRIEAGRSHSPVDLVWINGQTFYQLRQIHALWGPFTQVLPNSRLIDWSNPFIAKDFQQPVDDQECPWGNVQLLLIANRDEVPHPPRTPKQLAAWIHAHPGRFTFDTSFTGMGFLKSLMYAFAPSPRELEGPFNQATYAGLRDRVFDWIRSVRPDLWRHGETFPSDPAELNRLFASGEVAFTMSYNDDAVDNKVNNGLFPASAYAFVLDSGTLQNSHYIGIVAGSPHEAADMVVVNFLISPEAQWEKLKAQVWGDGTVLDTARLSPTWRQRFRAAAQRQRAPSRAHIEVYARQEPAPQVTIDLARDFRRTFLGE